MSKKSKVTWLNSAEDKTYTVEVRRKSDGTFQAKMYEDGKAPAWELGATRITKEAALSWTEAGPRLRAVVASLKVMNANYLARIGSLSTARA